MEWSSPAVQYAASAILAIFAAGFTAYWTYWFGVRQRQWERVLETKGQRVDDFLDATREYVKVVHLSSNLHTASRLADVDARMANLAMLVQRLLVDSDSSGSKALNFMAGHVVPDYFPDPAKAPETEARCRKLMTGLHNQVVSRLTEALHEVQNKYARLSMVCYDPERPAVLKRHAVKLAQRIVDHPPPSKEIDFTKEFARWVELSGHVIVYLRLDLDASLRGFRRATRLKQSWKEKHRQLSTADDEAAAKQ